MGYFFEYGTEGMTAKEYKQHVVRSVVNGAKQSGQTVLDHGGGSNELFILVETYTKKRVILCYKLQRNEGMWGYKPMDEEMYPYCYTCPERILKESTSMVKNAIEWRERCREVRKEKANKRGERSNKISAMRRDQEITVFGYMSARFQSRYRSSKVFCVVYDINSRSLFRVHVDDIKI